MWFSLILTLFTGLQAAPQTRPSTRPAPTPDEIRRAVRQLNHPSVTQRRAATRQLAEWGPLAFGELRQAAASPALESALAARDLLRELEAAVLIGAEVRLEVDRTRIAWDEPVTLRVHARNPTGGPLRVPWETPTTSRPVDRLADHEQVARMLDAADFLVVTGPDGRNIGLRVEPIERDPAVAEAVEVRARGTPPTHIVEAGRSAELDIPLFNRGWARFPMLHAGTYTIQFDYQPSWKDESWVEDGFGRVRSEPITIEVAKEAPQAIRRATMPLALKIAIEGDRVLAQVTSSWDIPVWMNLNLGGQKSASAHLQWELIPVRVDDPEAVPLRHEPEDTRVELERIVRIDPGTTRTISELPADKVRSEVARLESETPFHYALQIRYSHFASTAELQQALGPAAGRLPAHVFTGALHSEEIDPPR